MSEVFWTFLTTSSFGFLLAVARMMYKSKCKDIKCGCLRIERDVGVEQQELEFQTIHRPPSVGANNEEMKQENAMLF